MFEVLTLGGIDINFVSAAVSQYLVVDQAGDPIPKVEDTYVPLRASSGARLVTATEGEIPFTLVMIPFGDTLPQAKARRNAIEVPLLAARNWRITGIVTTYVEKDFEDTTAETWRIIGGRLRQVSVLPGDSGRLVALAGKYVAPCVVDLVLSKN